MSERYFRLMAVFALLCVVGAPRSEAHDTSDARSLLAYSRQHSSKFVLPPLRDDGETMGDTTSAVAALVISDEESRFNAIVAAQQSNLFNKAYPLLAARWPDPFIVVCWETPTDNDADQRRLVRAAVEETWAQHAKLSFVYWERCHAETKGVRVRIADDPAEGSHVKYLGKYLSYDYAGHEVVVEDGMVLNFAVENVNPVCESKVNVCIAVLAVHEFGHAIGFAHEQNRHDTDWECTEAAQGPDGDTVDLTPWDADSVMNYCKDIYAGGGTLSEYDIEAVQMIYGKG